MLTRALATTIVLIATCLAAAPATAGSQEDPVSVETNTGGNHGAVDVTADDPGHPGGATGGGGGSAAQPGSVKTPGTQTCSAGGVAVPCTSDSGVWNDALQCWVQRMSPQPPTSEPIWDGHTDGAIYWATCPDPTGLSSIGGDHMFWAPSPGAAGAPELVDPVTLAEEAIERMDLVGARVGATPLDPTAPGVVGIQTWLWVADADEHSWGPITRTATAGSVSVTATAKATKVVWDTGDGSTLTCRTPGTEWTRAKGEADSPTCGHTYLLDSGDQPDDAYQVQATTHWAVDWSGAGQAGTIDFTLTGPARALEIVELQALRTS